MDVAVISFAYCKISQDREREREKMKRAAKGFVAVSQAEGHISHVISKVGWLAG